MTGENPAAVHQLIYISAATVPFGAAELTSLLLRARDNNKRSGLSGLLVHKSGSFFQVLEGNEAVVEALYERISRDKRHHRVLVLARGTAQRRSFGGWSMGFVAGERAELIQVPGFNDFFHRGLAGTSSAEGASRAKDLALAFRDGRFRQFVEAT